MHPKLSRLFYYLYHDGIKRDRKIRNLKRFRKMQWLTPCEVENYQRDRLKSLLLHVHRQSPYYRGLMEEVGFDPERFDPFETLAELPFLTKDVLRSRLAEIACPGVDRRHFRKNATSGSTGEATYFFSDRRFAEAKTPLYLRSYEWVGIEIGDRELRLWGAAFDVRRAKMPTERIKRFFNNQAVLSAYDMSPDGMDSMVRFIKSFRPDFVFSYPSSLLHLIEHLKGDGGSIRGMKIKAVMTSGEQLYEWQRQEIARFFEAPVINSYGCREVGLIAQECDRRMGLHVIPENVFLEVVDEDGNPIGGREGEIVVTDLCNHAAPFIRYRIGDRGILLEETCPCGREGLPLLKVLGRTFDIIRSPAGGAVGGTFWTLLFKARPGIRRFRVVQDRIDHIRVDYIPESDQVPPEDSFRYFRECIGEKLEGLQVEFVPVDLIPIPPSGKQQFVISKLNETAP